MKIEKIKTKKRKLDNVYFSYGKTKYYTPLKMNFIKGVYLYKSFWLLGKTLDKCFDCKYCRVTINNNYDILPTDINPHFKNIPVAINLIYGDPMLQIDSTLEYLKRLHDAKHGGIIAIITKGKLHDKLLEFDKFGDLNVYIGLSTIGIDAEWEGGKKDIFLYNLEFAKKLEEKYPNNVKVGIEFRPIIYNINDDIDTISWVVNKCKQYNYPLAYSGLQVPPENKKKIEELGFKPYPNTKFGYKKYLSKEIESNIRHICSENKVACFKKTSCIISYLFNRIDYNAHYYRPNTVGCKDCLNYYNCRYYPENRCFPSLRFNRNLEDTILIKKCKIIYKDKHICGLMKSGQCEFPDEDCNKIKGWMLKTDIKLTTSDVRLIKWLTGFTVDAEFIELPYIQDFWYYNKLDKKEYGK